MTDDTRGALVSEQAPPGTVWLVLALIGAMVVGVLLGLLLSQSPAAPI